ncbi:MAG: metallophosphoesterase [Kiritimatiellales bacterium]
MKRLFFFFLLQTGWFAFAGESVCFVQLTDTHFGQGDHFERGAAAVEAINALPMDVSFVVITGDIMHDCIADSNQVNRVFQTLEKLKMPVYFVPGNHDLLKKAPEATVGVFTNRFGPLVSSAEYGGVDFMFVCTAPLSRGFQIPGYDPICELDAVLSDRPAVVFHHIPSADDFYSNRMHDGWGRTDAGREWSAVLNRHNVKAVITGHFHRDELHWIGEVPLFVGPPLSGRLGRQAAFRIYECRDGQLEYWTHYLE